ncbi:MAG: diaminopimelate epimerase [Deltaproteobacteria bacterium]|nr:diaminopimelate epimerase [Deltaproteobacteria bacterium]
MEIPHRIPFMKMTGSGNDFILVDNRRGLLDADSSRHIVRMACRRKLSVGADGFILIEDDPEVDFLWRFFNADGSEAEMCGNGSRCAARFAHMKGITSGPSMSFRTLAGIIQADVRGERVKVRMTSPHSLETDFYLQIGDRPFCLHFINTGVPHVVNLVEDADALEQANVLEWGRALRFHSRFQPEGSNVNFALVRDSHHMVIRTYERGVEDETLACGTGSIASALVAAAKQLVSAPVEVLTRGGETLTIHFDNPPVGGKAPFNTVFLEGDAKVVYEAELWSETLEQ